MNGPKPDKLDNLIMQAFREEARRIVVPPSNILWDNLQQQLENLELRKMRGEQSGQFDPGGLPCPGASCPDAKEGSTTPQGKDGGRYRWAGRWKKHSYLAGLAAACLLLIVFYAGSPEGSGLRGCFSRFLPVQQENQNSKLSMGSLHTDESTGENSFEMGRSVAKKSPGMMRTYSAEEQEAAGDESFELFTGQTEAPAEQPSGLTGQLNAESRTFVEIAGIGSDKGPEINCWQEEKAFYDSLEIFRGQTDNVIILFADLPEDYAFQEGVITEAERSLQNIYQEFANDKGLKLTLNQLFYEDESAAAQAMETAKEKATPLQVRFISGYLARSPEGLVTLTWKDGKTILTLSGEIEDETALENYLAHLRSY